MKLVNTAWNVAINKNTMKCKNKETRCEIYSSGNTLQYGFSC